MTCSQKELPRYEEVSPRKGRLYVMYFVSFYFNTATGIFPRVSTAFILRTCYLPTTDCKYLLGCLASKARYEVGIPQKAGRPNECPKPCSVYLRGTLGTARQIISGRVVLGRSLPKAHMSPLSAAIAPKVLPLKHQHLRKVP